MEGIFFQEILKFPKFGDLRSSVRLFILLGFSVRKVLSVKLISSAKTEELIAVTLQHSFCLELMGLHPS